MEKDIFTFDDFLNKPKSVDKTNESPSFTEDFPTENLEKIEENYQKEEQEDSTEEEIVTEELDTYYKLYKDKNEEFICDISVEGSDPNETQARIIIESKDWTLMFNGEINNGKCVVPIRRLNILNEGQVGNIRLEVIVEGNIFVPWEDKYKVKVSKKVTVKVNEQKKNPTKLDNNDIKVKVKGLK